MESSLYDFRETEVFKVNYGLHLSLYRLLQMEYVETSHPDVY